VPLVFIRQERLLSRDGTSSEGESSMVMTDPIADLLTRIRNANLANHDQLDVPVSKVKTEVVRLLKQEGYVRDYKVIPESPQGILRIYMKYGPNAEKVITGIKRVSKPGCRVFCRSKEIPVVFNRLGITIVSTSRGLMTGNEAKKLSLGGELICEVW
jgi:small subunit ribosomal protein S8